MKRFMAVFAGFNILDKILALENIPIGFVLWKSKRKSDHVPPNIRQWTFRNTMRRTHG
jgi:hypothetical protein